MQERTEVAALLPLMVYGLPQKGAGPHALLCGGLLWRPDDEKKPVTKVTWTLEALDGGKRTRVTLVHDGFEYMADRSDYLSGWAGFLDRPFGLPTPRTQQAMTALRNLFDSFGARHGVGASGVDFFATPGVSASPENRRDLIVLHSLAQALQLLAGPQFQAAFGGSTNQNDYRWGKLHRIVFAHPMDSSFSVPPAFGFFPAPLPGLRGIPTDGGLGVVDASAHDARAASSDAFMFGSGPSNRLVVELRPGRVRAESVWPGGASGVPGTWNYLNLLPLWLTNDTVPLPFAEDEVERGAASIERFVP